MWFNLTSMPIWCDPRKTDGGRNDDIRQRRIDRVTMLHGIYDFHLLGCHPPFHMFDTNIKCFF